MSEPDRVPDLHLADVVHDGLRNRGRQRFHVDLARDLLEHAAFLDARRLLDAVQLQRDGRLDLLVEVHAQEVDVRRLPVDGMALCLLWRD